MIKFFLMASSIHLGATALAQIFSVNSMSKSSLSIFMFDLINQIKSKASDWVNSSLLIILYLRLLRFTVVSFSRVLKNSGL